jgi:hypothetical protein
LHCASSTSKINQTFQQFSAVFLLTKPTGRHILTPVIEAQTKQTGEGPMTRTQQIARQFTRAQIEHKLAAATGGLAAYPGSVHYTRRVMQLNAALEIRVQNGWS